MQRFCATYPADPFRKCPRYHSLSWWSYAPSGGPSSSCPSLRNRRARVRRSRWLGVVSLLVIADLTGGTGRFNLTLGAITTAVGIGAALSQTIAGSVVHHVGPRAGAGVASAALGVLYWFMPETRKQTNIGKAP